MKPEANMPENQSIEALLQRVQDLENQLAAAQQENEVRYRALFEVSLEAILIHENGIVVDGNAAFEQILGYSLAELKGTSVLNLLDKESYEVVRARLRNSDPQPSEVVAIKKDGTPLDIELTSREHTYQGRTVRVVSARDISARMAERQQRLLAEALRDTAAALNSSLDPDEVIQSMLINVGKLVEHDTVDIMLLEGDIARIAYWRGYEKKHTDFLKTFTLSIASSPILNYLYTTRQPLIISDTHDYKGWIRHPHSDWIRAFASAPIMMDGQVIGFINLDSATPHAFNNSHARRLQEFADQAAIAIKNARLYAQVSEQRALAEALRDTAAALNSSLDPDDVMRSILENVGRVVRHDAANIAMLDGNTLHYTQWRGYNPRYNNFFKQFTLNVHDTPNLRHVVEFRKPYAIPDTHSYTGWVQNEYTAWIRSFASAPIVLDGELLGLLNLDSGTPHTLTQAHAEHLQIFADQAALAIKNARLYAEARQHAEALEQQIIQKAEVDNALQDSESRNRAMLDAMPDYIFRLNREGVYLDARNSNSISSDDIIGRKLKDFMPPAVASRAQYYINRTLDTHTMQVYEYQVPQGEDDLRDYEARLVVYGHDEVLAVVRDITERKRAELELARARDQALEASRIKSQFLANISHELRTPLNSIINYAQLMLDGIYGALNRTQFDRLEKVSRNSHHLLALIEDVLDLSKIEAGHMVLKRRRVNTFELLTGVMDTFRPMAEEKGLTLHYGGGDVPDIHVDETRARQVLTNIVSNAIKFTSQGSISIQTHRDEEMLIFSISDTGIGIPRKAMETIFEQFRQVDNSYTRQYEGTGMGLTISRRLTELHGGTIKVESEVGKGSTFHIYLPIDTAEEPEKEM